MAVKTLLADYIVTAEPSTPVRDLAEIMDRQGVGSVVVVEGEKPIGIVTDRDLALKVLKGGKDPEGVRAKDVMERDLITAKAGSDIRQILRRMSRNKVRRMPIVEDGKLVDIVTLDDAIKVLAGELADLSEVIEAETPEIFKRK